MTHHFRYSALKCFVRITVRTIARTVKKIKREIYLKHQQNSKSTKFSKGVMLYAREEKWNGNRTNTIETIRIII